MVFITIPLKNILFFGKGCEIFFQYILFNKSLCMEIVALIVGIL